MLKKAALRVRMIIHIKINNSKPTVYILVYYILHYLVLKIYERLYLFYFVRLL